MLDDKQKSGSKLFTDLAATMKAVYNKNKNHHNKINDQEANKAALNLIEFCKRFIEIQVRIEREQQKKLEPG